MVPLILGKDCCFRRVFFHCHTYTPKIRSTRDSFAAHVNVWLRWMLSMTNTNFSHLETGGWKTCGPRRRRREWHIPVKIQMGCTHSLKIKTRETEGNNNTLQTLSYLTKHHLDKPLHPGVPTDRRVFSCTWSVWLVCAAVWLFESTDENEKEKHRLPTQSDSIQMHSPNKARCRHSIVISMRREILSTIRCQCYSHSVSSTAQL